MERDNSNPMSVAMMVKKADDRLYRTLMFMPMIARLVYAMAIAVAAITGFVMKTQWDIAELDKYKADKVEVVTNASGQERNAKLVDQMYKDVYHRDPPPR